MNKMFPALLLVALLSSCSSVKTTSYYRSVLKGYNEPKEANTSESQYIPTLEDFDLVYLVDTITIKNPIDIFYRGQDYVTSKEVLKNNQINNAFFERADVYLFDTRAMEYFRIKRKGHSSLYLHPYPTYAQYYNAHTLSKKGIKELGKMTNRIFICEIYDTKRWSKNNEMKFTLWLANVPQYKVWLDATHTDYLDKDKLPKNPNQNGYVNYVENGNKYPAYFRAVLYPLSGTWFYRIKSNKSASK